MQRNFCVYQIENQANGHKYIGKTNADTRRRWRNHIDTSTWEPEHRQAIHNAIATWGVDSFEFTVLEYFETSDEAYAAEIRYIAQFNTYHGVGYNETPGGKGPGAVCRNLSDEQVVQLFVDYATTDMSAVQLAVKYDTAKPSILDCLKGVGYADVSVGDELRYQAWLKRHRNIYETMEHKGANFQKTTPETVRAMFEDFATGDFSIAQMAAKYTMRVGNVAFILQRDTNKRVDVPEHLIQSAAKLLKERRNPRNHRTDNERYGIKNAMFWDSANGMTTKEIATKHDYQLSHTIKILNGTVWGDIMLHDGYDAFMLPKLIQLTDEQAMSVIRQFCDGKTEIQLCEAFHATHASIVAILDRTSFRHLQLGELEERLAMIRVQRNEEDRLRETTRDRLCTQCNYLLVPNENWAPYAMAKCHYLCRSCNSARVAAGKRRRKTVEQPQ